MIYDLGSGNVTYVTEQTFNNGEWIKINSKRDKKKSIFYVQNVTFDRRVSPGLQDTLEIGDKIYLGGFKGKHNIR